jgi:hypothetical protein
MPFGLPPGYAWLFVGLFVVILTAMVLSSRRRRLQFRARATMGKLLPEWEDEEQRYRAERQRQLDSWIQDLERSRARREADEANRTGEHREWVETVIGGTRADIFKIMHTEVRGYLKGVQSQWTSVADELAALHREVKALASAITGLQGEEVPVPIPPWPGWAQRTFREQIEMRQRQDRQAILNEARISSGEEEVLASNLDREVRESDPGVETYRFLFDKLAEGLCKPSGERKTWLPRKMAETALFLWGSPNGGSDRAVLTFVGSRSVLITDRPLPSQEDLIAGLQGRRARYG